MDATRVAVDIRVVLLNPWTSSAWNSPAGVASVLQTPLSYLVSHPYAVVQFGAAAIADTPGGHSAHQP